MMILVTILWLIHDAARPELNDWYMSLTSRGKMPCCDLGEATRIADPDWENNKGHYRVKLEGVWVDVPDDAVVDGANRAGTALVWPTYEDGHRRKVRCFMPGTMT